jgi:ABC-type dipeptide/oligopeptide/nickel transport system ATPase component
MNAADTAPATATGETITPSKQLVLEIEHLDVHYGEFHAVKDASVRVYEGEKVAIVGESGSGKTTLGLAIGGFISPQIGTVTSTVFRLSDKDVTPGHTRIPRAIPGISMVFQDAMTSLDAVWRAGTQIVDVLRHTHKLSKREAKLEAERRLASLGIPDPERVMHALPHELSGGMRQRVMVAVATAGDPKLLIADEPTSALDVNIAISTMETLTALADTGTSALLFVTHDIELCARYADYVIVMQHGVIVEHLKASELRKAEHPYTIGLMMSVPTLDRASLDQLPIFDSDDQPESEAAAGLDSAELHIVSAGRGAES